MDKRQELEDQWAMGDGRWILKKFSSKSYRVPSDLVSACLVSFRGMADGGHQATVMGKRSW
jgi:hypothetical protein